MAAKGDSITVIPASSSTTIGRLVSRLPHQVELLYGGEYLILPPRGEIKGLTRELLGSLPAGTMFVPSSNTQQATFEGGTV